MSSYNKTFKNIEKKELSTKIISYLKDVKPKRLYNYYDYGGYLIYNNIEVFIDGRADLYSKYNYEDAYRLSKLSGDFQKIIDKYNFDYYLVNKNSGLSNYLKLSNNYDLVMSDKKVSIYKTKE